MGQPNAHITKCDDLDMSLKASLHSTLGQAQVEALFHPLSGQSDLESTFQTPNLTIPNGLPLISRRSSSASCNSRNSIPFRPISGTSIPRSNTMTTNSYTPQSFVLARGYGSRVGPVASQMPISNRAPEAEVLDDPPSLHTGLYTHTHGHKTEGSGLATNLQNDIAKQGKTGSVLARLPVNAPLLERPLGRNDISLCVSGSPCAQKNQHNTTVVGNYRARGEATFSARRAGTLLFTAGGSKAETEAGAEVGASPSPPPQPRTRHRSQPDSGLASTLSGKLDAATRNGPLLTTQQSLLNTHSYGTGHVSSVKGGERVALVSPLTYRSIPPKRPQPFQGALGQTKDLPRSHGRPDDGHAINTARPLKSPPHRTSLLHEETAAAAAATRSVTEPFEETRSHLHTQHQLPLGLRESISAPFDTTPPALLQPMRSSATCDLKIQTTGSSDAPQSRSELESTHAPCRSGHKATFQKQRNSMPVSSLSTSPRGNLNHIYTGPLLDQPTRTGRPPSQPELFNGRRTISHTAEESTSSLHQLATNPLSSAVTSSYSSRSGLTCDSGTTSESGGSSLSVVSSENSNSKGLNDGRSLQHLYLRQTSRTRRSLDTADTGQGRSVSPLALFTDVTQSPTTSSPVIVFEHTPPSPVSATMTVDASCPVSIKHLNTFGTSRDQSTEAVSESSPFSARASGRRIRSMLSVSSRWTLNTSMSQSHSQRSFVGLSENSSNSEIYNSNAGIGDQDIVLDNSSAHLSVSRKPSFDQSRMSGWSASPSISMDFSREHHRIPTGSNINLAQSTVPQSDGSSSSSGRQSIRSAMEGLDKSGRLSTRQINTVLRESELCHQQTFSRAKKILINLCTTEEPTDERSDMQGNNAPSGYLKKEGRISRSVSAMQLIASKRGGMDEIQSPNRSAKAPLAFLSAVKERDPKPVAKERTHRWGKLFRLFTIRRQLLIMFLDVIKFTPLELPLDQVTMLWDKIKSDEQNAAARAIAARLRTLISDRDQFMSKKAVDSIEMLISPHVKSFNKYPYQQRRNFCQLINAS
ncbi:hypothetical protein BASA62_008765 [Batrachochytrium salamandrivorans]|nr:hypothetical protein BASA62_008765 [Batrachochytrium salamandrivorans]